MKYNLILALSLFSIAGCGVMGDCGCSGDDAAKVAPMEEKKSCGGDKATCDKATCGGEKKSCEGGCSSCGK